MTITASADGSALGNPGPAGWAWYIDESTWAAGGWPHGTNNMGELKAVLDLLEATAVDADQHLHVLCDSQYVINSVTKWMPGWKRKGWKKADGKPVMNVDLLKGIDKAMAGRSVEFEWVKGHAGHAMNEAADRRANAAAVAFKKKQQVDAGPGYRGAAPRVTVEPAADAEPAVRTEPAAGVPSRRGASRGAGTATTAPAPSESDLFSLFDLDDPFTDGASFEDVVTREQALLTDAVRSDPALAAELLHPAFAEIGASGRTFDRESILAALAPLEGVEASDFIAEEISPDVVLLRFVTGEGRGTVRRTSLWVCEQGRWLLRHHQGTLEQ